MPEYEYMTVYVKQQHKPGNGDGPNYEYVLAAAKEFDAGELQSVAGIAEALESYQQFGWTLVALVLVESQGDAKVYEVTLRREIQTG